MKKLILALVVVVLAGCALRRPEPTLQDKLTDDDFSWTIAERDYTYQEAFQRMEFGFQKCGTPVKKELFTDNQSGYIYVYLKDGLGATTPWVLGKVDIAAKAKRGTTVKIGVIIKHNQPFTVKLSRIHEMWLKYLDNDYSGCAQPRANIPIQDFQ